MFSFFFQHTVNELYMINLMLHAGRALCLLVCLYHISVNIFTLKNLIFSYISVPLNHSEEPCFSVFVYST